MVEYKLPKLGVAGSIPVARSRYNETFEKCSLLFKFKSKIPHFEREKTKILTTGIP